MKSTALLFIVASVLGSSVVARADIVDYDLFKILVNTEAPDSSTSFSYAYAGERVITQNSGDITDAEASRPNGTLDNMTLDSDNVTWDFVSGQYNSSASLLSDFPLDNGGNAYGYYADGFTLFGVLFDPQTMWNPTAPVINLSTLTNVIEGQNTSVSWSTYTKDPNASEADIFTSLTDNTLGKSVFANQGDNSYTSDVLPGSDLIAGHNYTLGVDFSNREVTVPNNGFGNASAIASYDVLTNYSFSVQSVPSPNPFILIGMSTFGLGILRRKK